MKAAIGRNAVVLRFYEVGERKGGGGKRMRGVGKIFRDAKCDGFACVSV